MIKKILKYFYLVVIVSVTSFSNTDSNCTVDIFNNVKCTQEDGTTSVAVTDALGVTRTTYSDGKVSACSKDESGDINCNYNDGTFSRTTTDAYGNPKTIYSNEKSTIRDVRNSATSGANIVKPSNNGGAKSVLPPPSSGKKFFD